jgi:hypothetical protein
MDPSASPIVAEGVLAGAHMHDTDASYYDHADFPYHPACDAAAGGPGWAKPTNEGTTACGPSVKDLDTNAVVAMNVSWLNQNGYAARLTELCGRE